jgi:DeoR family transcriptional regulator of aga operon
LKHGSGTKGRPFESFWQIEKYFDRFRCGREQQRALAVEREGDRKIPAQRRAEIRALLKGRGAASIAELSAAIGVSASTVRRDLDRLSADGFVSRSHGGAVTGESTTFESTFEDRCRHNSGEKERIGRRAAGLLKPGYSVIFDSSSTVLWAVEALKERPVPMTAVTNDIGLASVLAEIPEVDVLVPGGEIREGSLTLVGGRTRDFLEGLHADVAFVGIHAISGTLLTDTSLPIAEVKRAMIGASHRVVLLADHSKFGPPAFCEVARTGVAGDLFTDELAPPEALEAVGASGETRVHVVGEASSGADPEKGER